MEAKVLKLSPQDNVVIALDTLTPGAVVRQESIATKGAIPAGHKIAIADIAKDSPILKYGQIIGFAGKNIIAGEHVHTHNVEMRDFQRDYQFGKFARMTEYSQEQAMFQGIRRSNGKVATRNYVGIISSVNCSASVTRYIAERFRAGTLNDFENIDGVVAITHDVGCCMGPEEEGMKMLRRTLAGYAGHANFSEVFMVGLGCETNQISMILENPALDASNISSMTIQEVGGTRATVERGVAMIKERLEDINQIKREPTPASELIVGLECGGSDGYSGISANPALGVATDILVRQGGTAILAETPEIYGAEHLLTARAASQEVGLKLVDLITWWEGYASRNGSQINNNPTFGNKAGGLTTILEKSLGAVAKGGSTSLMDVYKYAEPIVKKGFVFMDSPGYDPVSITGMVASGANIVCFTTGRGSVYGCKPTPSLKLATNTPMYKRMEEDMDMNCGRIIDGDATVQEMGEQIFKRILGVASGKKTKSELLGMGDNEFTPWMIGAQM